MPIPPDMHGDTLPGAPPSMSLRRRLITGGLSALLIATGVVLAYLWGEQTGVRALRQTMAHRLDVYAVGLHSELTRYDYLPGILSLNKDVIALLQSPDDTVMLDRVNRYLHTVNQKAGSSDIYVMNMEGLTLAASNWNAANSFVGKNFSYRPYFTDAVKGLPGRFYGIGTVSQAPGYYFSYGIYRDNRMVGVAALKVDLDKLDDAWLRADERVVVVDENGIVFLTSVPDWKFKALAPLSASTQAQLAVTRQYHLAGEPGPIGLNEVRVLADDASVVRVAQRGAQGHAGLRDPAGGSATRLGPSAFIDPLYLAQSRAIPGTGWKLIVLSDMGPIRSRARISAISVAFALAFLGISALYVRQRRRAIAQNVAAKEALQRAHDELERKVALRTGDLSNANLHLQTEIAERKRAEVVLKAAMEELVQAGKMAALGQMSAGVTHELNQPLAALRTLSDNAIVLLQRGQTIEVEANLELISDLITRMGKITGQLKKFARKSPAELRPTSVSTVIADAVFLMGQRFREAHTDLDTSDVPSDMHAYCDANRLEQVFVNLFGNALDSMAQSETRVVTVSAREDGPVVRIAVRDRGAGIAPEHLPRLFEPFFTTKEQGAGLGLGLAISAGIVREFGGTLKARNHPDGGAEFVIQLRSATIEESADA